VVLILCNAGMVEIQDLMRLSLIVSS